MDIWVSHSKNLCFKNFFLAMRHIYANRGDSDIKVYGAGLLQLVRKASDLGFSIVGNGEDFWAKNNDLGSMGYILR